MQKQKGYIRRDGRQAVNLRMNGRCRVRAIFKAGRLNIILMTCGAVCVINRGEAFSFLAINTV